ncbi:hypothetical protein L2E82_24330 [Cichorium intybus]|uniref:Uncharacterized protein n=1 Tax=Cichorium intybus TaxID=13427 RepID=A0ACB9E118_CICIN|nr:hypothetical protein L2E82_24330 [Cichorium intybus]
MLSANALPTRHYQIEGKEKTTILRFSLRSTPFRQDLGFFPTFNIIRALQGSIQEVVKFTNLLLKVSVDEDNGNTMHVTVRLYGPNTEDAINRERELPNLHTFYKWLKPGGKVLISAYCRKSGKPSQDFGEYIKQRGYDLHDVETYGKMLKDAGFVDVIAEDRTEQFREVLKSELERVEKEKEEFIQDFSEEDYNDIVGGWKSKLVRTGSDEQK